MQDKGLDSEWNQKLEGERQGDAGAMLFLMRRPNQRCSVEEPAVKKIESAVPRVEERSGRSGMAPTSKSQTRLSPTARLR